MIENYGKYSDWNHLGNHMKLLVFEIYYGDNTNTRARDLSRPRPPTLI